MCAGGCCYFRPSKPHSGTLCAATATKATEYADAAQKAEENALEAGTANQEDPSVDMEEVDRVIKLAEERLNSSGGLFSGRWNNE